MNGESLGESTSARRWRARRRNRACQSLQGSQGGSQGVTTNVWGVNVAY